MKNRIKNIVGISFGLIMLLFVINLSAGNVKDNVQCQRMLKKSDAAYSDKKYSIAAENYEAYLKKANDSKKKNTVITKLLDCYLQMREYSKAMAAYDKIENKSNFTFADKNMKVRVSDLLARYGKYDDAYDLLKTVDGFDLKTKGFTQKSIADMMKDSTRWNVYGLNFNSGYREYAPCLINKTLLFSSNRPLSEKKDANEWDGFSYSRLWQTDVLAMDTSNLDSVRVKRSVENKGEKRLADVYELAEYGVYKRAELYAIRTPKTEGGELPTAEILKGLDKIRFNVGSFTADKNNHVYFSANSSVKDKNGEYEMCIMEGDYDGNSVNDIKELKIADGAGVSYSVLHPAVNNEGTFLVFASDKSGGAGGYDLYYSQRTDRTKPWGEVRPFGTKINTAGNEVYPVITKDGYLFFSSDGLPGLGGLDLFKILLTDALSTKKVAPEHLNYPINSRFDDFGWSQDTKGEKSFFTSDRVNDNDNIYMAVKAKYLGSPYIAGYVKDKVTKKPIAGADVFMWLKNSNDVVVTKTDANGKYVLPVKERGDAVLKATKSDLGSDCAQLGIKVKRDSKDTIQWVNYVLSLGTIYRVGYTWKLDNIHYDYNKWNIRPDARPILDNLAEILKQYPITVELSSHTDSRGNDQYNMKLSELRAKSAVDYLVSKGIDRSKVIAKGYGETKLLNRCANGVPCSEEEHQQNRRTEVKVLNYTEPNTVKNIYIENVVSGQVLKLSDLPKDFFKNCGEDSDSETESPDEQLKQNLTPGQPEDNHSGNRVEQVFPENTNLSYYVVVSSSVDKKASENMLRSVISKGYNAVMLYNGQRYRIAVKCLSQADAEQRKIQIQSVYKDAWILAE